MFPISAAGTSIYTKTLLLIEMVAFMGVCTCVNALQDPTNITSICLQFLFKRSNAETLTVSNSQAFIRLNIGEMLKSPSTKLLEMM